MPLYTYKHPEKEKYVDVVQSMNQDHTFTDEQGLQWERVFVNPNTSIGSRIDGSEENFKSYFDNKKGTLGDAWDVSREASEKRKQKYGHDPVQKQYYEQYSSNRQGKKHISDNG